MFLRFAYYKRFGVRRQSDLITPTLHSVNTLTLPKESVYHYFPTENTGFGMDQNDAIMNGYQPKFAMMAHITDYTDEEPLGRFRQLPGLIRPEMMKYHRDHRKFRHARDYTAALHDPRMLLIFNYAPLHISYKYSDTPMRPYHDWWNRYRTLWATIAKVAKETNRQQYVILDIPSVQPPLSALTKYEQNGMTLSLLHSTLPHDDAFVVADFWTWLGHERSKSPIAQVAEEDLNRINIIFLEMGRWTVLNLGILNSWRKRDENETPLDLELTKEVNKGLMSISGELDTVRLQRRAIRFFMALNEATLSANSIDGSDADVVAEVKVPERDASGQLVLNPDSDEQAEVSQPKLERPDSVKSAPVKEEKPKPEVPAQAMRFAQTHEKAKRELVEDVSDDVVMDKVEEPVEVYSDEDIERDLAKLEEIAKNRVTVSTVQYNEYVPPKTELEHGVLSQADEMVKKGLLSAAQYRRMEKLANKYKELPNPYGEGKLIDLLTIKESETKVDEHHPLMEKIEGVSDKSMLSSSLKAFDHRYVSTVLKKDVAKMGLALQKAGIAVHAYEVEREETVNDHFEVHTFRVQPVVGAASTVRFRLPVVDKNGNFKVAGVMNRMRKQRGDLPIRKIDPSTVALTSYYSKLFVHRADRAVFNYEAWIGNQIAAKGSDDQDSSVTELRFGKAFTNLRKLPRLYTAIAKRFLGFRSGDYVFDFRWDKREAIFGKEIVDVVDAHPNLALIGHERKTPIVVDMQNKMHALRIEGKKLHLSPIPDMETLLGLQKSRAPVEIAEMGLFAKTVPVGFVLGYHVGLGDLLATMKIPHRREKTRSHYKLADDEFDIRFEDETLVFKRDPVAMLIFGGFNRYHRDIKRISIYAFDKKDIYANVFENNGVPGRTVREIDLMFKMWVDHITEEILKEMGKPTDLFHLLVEAVKMLETDDHPDAMDNLYMRDKGYERFAGIAYTEMVKAMRTYAMKPQNANATVGLNPEAVWHTLLADATVMQVEDSNPIANVQEKEVVVYRGEGGRSARSMTAKFRGYHKNGLGLVSEANVDNGDVATVTYTTADPNYRSLRGMIRPLEKVEGNSGKVLATSTLISPGATTDDPKRIKC